MTRDDAFDPVRIIEILKSHRVDFVLVGGYAALLYGARRPTYDVDITPATDAGNLQRLSDALRELKAGIRVDNLEDGLSFDSSAESLRGVQMLNLRSPFGDLDITFAPAGFPDGYQAADLVKEQPVAGAMTGGHQQRLLDRRPLPGVVPGTNHGRPIGVIDAEGGLRCDGARLDEQLGDLRAGQLRCLLTELAPHGAGDKTTRPGSGWCRSGGRGQPRAAPRTRAGPDVSAL